MGNRPATSVWWRGASIALALALACSLGATGCGYQFTARALADTQVSLRVESDAVEPGLPLAVARALRGTSSVHGVVWVAPEPGLPQLRVVVTEVRTEPLGISKFEAAGTSSVAATSYRTEVVLSAVLVTRTGEELGEEHFVGVAEFEDHLVPLATERQRNISVERATVEASGALSVWAATLLLPSEASEPLAPEE